MNYCHLLIAVFVCISSFFSCTQDKKPVSPTPTPPEISALDTAQNPVRFTVGQKWHYRNTFYNRIDSGSAPLYFPETLVAFINYNASKDTVMMNDTFIIVEGKYFESSKFAIDSFASRMAIHFGSDTITVYEFSIPAFPGGLLKAQNQSPVVIPNSATTLSQFKRYMLAKKLAGTPYDTSIFHDLNYPLVFPLSENVAWYYRPGGDPRGNLPLRKTYLSQESITTPAGTFMAYKFRWELQEMLGMTDMSGNDWTSTVGLIKRFYDFGRSYMMNEVGIKYGTYTSQEVIEYYGAYNINSDTLKPLYRITPEAKAFADSHFNPVRFLSWYNEILVDTTIIIPDSLVHAGYFQQILQDKTDDYYGLIATYDEFVQGWDDVAPDMVDSNFAFLHRDVPGTDNDAHYRAYAIASITMEGSVVTDTSWMYYHTDNLRQPFPFGYSQNQLYMADLIKSTRR